jgi:hypothetical protein
MHMCANTNSIRISMNKLLSSGEFGGMLADEGKGPYVSEVNGRFVLPVKPTYKRKYVLQS